MTVTPTDSASRAAWAIDHPSQDPAFHIATPAFQAPAAIEVGYEQSVQPVTLFSSLIPQPGAARIYGLAVLLDTIGSGMMMTSAALYYTRIIHLPTAKVGLGLAAAGMIGLIASLPIGRLADLRGPRSVLRGTLLVQALITFCYLFIGNFPAFLAVATVDMLALTAARSVQGPLMRHISSGDPVGLSATTRAIANLGVSLGAVGSAVAVQLDTAGAYHALIIINAASFLGAWAVSGLLPRYQPFPRPRAGAQWCVISDKAFIAYAALNGVLSLQGFVIVLPLPLWVVEHTHAPRWSTALFLLINTIIVTLLQVRVGGNVKSLPQGGAAIRKAGIIFLASCSAMGLAAGLPWWAALTLLAAAVIAHSLGELWHTAATFALDFGFAPEHAQGQYQGMAAVGLGMASSAAPIVLIGLLLPFGRLGWSGLGLIFILAGLIAPAVINWGERTRPAQSHQSPVH